MALDINALRAAFSKKSEGQSEGGNSGYWDLFYPFYKMNAGDKAVFRFLPDADEENPLGFIVENKYHQLIINGKKKRIACSKMFGEACACCEKSQEYYNQGNKDMGLKFWRKVDYIGQGIIRTTPFEHPVDANGNQVRLISLGPKIYKLLEAEIVGGDLDEMPYDMFNGYDFNINKTMQGEYGDYSTSGFARKASPIPEDIMAKIELYDLKKYRFAKIEREQMEAMIEAFLTGKALAEGEAGAETPAATATEAPKATAPAETVVAAAAAAQPAPAATVAAAPADAGKKLTPQEILARLKAKQQG